MSALSLIAVAASMACTAPDGLELAPGWCASVFNEGVGPARHLVVDAHGDVYIRLRSGAAGGVVVLRDGDGDGVAETEQRFDETGGTGIAVHDDHLYLSTATAVYRYPLAPGEMSPSGERETVVSGLPGGHSHDSKSLAFDSDGWMYVNHGSPSNACQRAARRAGSPGMDPCPQLEREGGIWRFRADVLGQSQDDGERFATGIRNAVAIDFDPRSGAVWVVQHGRDQLDTLWSEHFDAAYNAENPGEELIRLIDGGDYGWPYCFWSTELDRRVLAPEYGGDGEIVGRCADTARTTTAFPGHWAPNDLLFIDEGALIAFHGSWNRAPFPQQGYRVVLQALSAAGELEGSPITVASGFAGSERLASSRDARYRPMGLAQGPDGAIYIVDSRVGRIWRLSRRP
jgi:glucose/arabinose dehydrogenase